jgi:hypothetical protein
MNVAPRNVGEILRFIQILSQSYDAEIRQKKLAREALKQHPYVIVKNLNARIHIS